MSNQTRVVADLSVLEDLVNQLGGQWAARVGILGSNAAKQDHIGPITNSELGLIHEFGSVSNNIPPRSFLRMPIEMKQKEIVASMADYRIKTALEAGNIKRVYQYLGLFAEAEVKKSFLSSGFGQWAPNKPETIERKGSDKPLIDTSQLRRSITSDVVKKSEL